MPQPPFVEPLRRWDPEHIGGYVLIGRLGAGAMGQVYFARSAAGRLVAVKTIKSELAEEPDFRTRFGQEVAAARRVSGAFTASVVAADSEADIPWLATVYVPAPSLSELVRRCGPMPTAAVRWLAAGCAEALESIHGVGLVHRDLKPSNVLVAPDGPRVIDFGVARAAERIQLTVTRGSVGTPAYMAPEQARDTRQATSASDVYSLGATMLFAASGHPPYRGETVMDVLVRLATEEADLSELPADLADIVVPCLARDPRNRPTAASVVARLAPELAESGQHVSAPLPRAAIDLIDGYRHAPRVPAAERAEGSSRGDVDRGGAAVGDDSTIGSLPAVTPRGTAHPGRMTRRLLFALGSAAAAAALVAAGWMIGDSAGASKSPRSGPAVSNTTSLGPVLPRPGQLGPPGAPGGPQTGVPFVGLNQPYGDSNTTFVLHGQNWPPGALLTITLLRGNSASLRRLKSPIQPLSDGAGTFNYAINQDHEFFSGGLPVGIYTVRVAAPGGAHAEAKFDVQRT